MLGEDFNRALSQRGEVYKTMNSKYKDMVVKVWGNISVALILAVFLGIIGQIVYRGAGALSWDFLRLRPMGMPLGREGGIYPAIIGSVALGAINILISSVLGVSTAIYMSMISNSKYVKRIGSMSIQCVMGIPSIVIGLFGYSVFVVVMNMGRSLLAGALTLSIMTLPVVIINTTKAIEDVDKEALLASYALGVSKLYTFIKIVWPKKKRDIISGIVIGAVYSLGATAPIMLTATVLSAPSPKSLYDPIMALPYHLYILSMESISLENAYGTALVLLVIFFLGNGFIRVVFNKKREEDES